MCVFDLHGSSLLFALFLMRAFYANAAIRYPLPFVGDDVGAHVDTVTVILTEGDCDYDCSNGCCSCCSASCCPQQSAAFSSAYQAANSLLLWDRILEI